jgi:hypothetical protein
MAVETEVAEPLLDVRRIAAEIRDSQESLQEKCHFLSGLTVTL